VGWREAVAQWLTGRFGRVLLALVEGGISLALFLLIEWGLLALAERTMTGHNEVVGWIVNGIQIMSALLVAVFFLVHGLRSMWHYWSGEPPRRGRRR
jgi:hypothetical protein